jgi:hypothetical protein
MRSRIPLAAVLAALVVACSSGADPLVVEPYPNEQGGSGLPAPPGPPPPTTGTPPPPSAAPVVFKDTAMALGKAGGFPSDLVADARGNLYTVDDAAIPARVLRFPGDGGNQPTMSVTVAAEHLIDHDGTSPARAPTSFGPGLFGAFTGDLELAFDRWLFVTVGAGSSVSSDGTRALRLANLVLIDTASAEVVQTVNLAWELPEAGALSGGEGYESIPQSLPAMCAFVPATNGTLSGEVYVAMSNGAGSSAGLSEFYAGTVQVWSVDFLRTTPLSPELAGRPAVHVTRTFESAYHNPVALTRYTAQSGVSYMLLTNAGASQFDSDYVLRPTTEAALEVLDLDTTRWRPAWDMVLGPVLPAPHALALGKDAYGHHFGLFSSQTYAAVYVVELEGLESNPVDPSRMGLVRTVDLAADGSLAAGSGYQPGIAVTSSGGGAVVSTFSEASLRVLDLPRDILSGPVRVDPQPFDTADLTAEAAYGLGALVVSPRTVAEVYVVVNGTFDANFLPDRQAYVGALWAPGRLP